VPTGLAENLAAFVGLRRSRKGCCLKIFGSHVAYVTELFRARLRDLPTWQCSS
jgi:hypothetical protein